MLALLALLHGDHASAFSWTHWEIDPSIPIGDFLLAAVYLYAIGPLRRRYGWAERVDPWRVASFLGGVLLMFLALTGPLDTLSDNFLFSMHMTQHMLLMLIMPPMLIWGVPPWLMRAAMRVRGVKPLARLLTHPIITYIVYNVVLIGWHFPGPYDYALAHESVHVIEHLSFMAVGVMMWWPIVNPLPELDRLRTPMLRLLYIFAMGLPMTALSAFITVAPQPLYVWYTHAPRLWGLTVMEDQQLGGAIMWIPGMIILWTAASVIFLRYSAQETHGERLIMPRDDEASSRPEPPATGGSAGPTSSPSGPAHPAPAQ